MPGDLASKKITLLFQSAPCTRVQGDINLTGCMTPHWMVSIRSLHQSTGRWYEWRGTVQCVHVSIRSLHQSTGRYPKAIDSLGPTQVSIRSLHQSTGRSSESSLLRCVHQCFNPLPAPEYREIRFDRDSQHGHACFNPLPAPEYREIQIIIPIHTATDVSIRSLHQSTGRYVDVAIIAVGAVKFQSAPCTRVQGDQATCLLMRAGLMFQSAPCTRVQGDLKKPQTPLFRGWFQSAPCTRVQGD